MVIRPGIELANLTDTGCVRSENEDYYCYVEPESDEEAILFADDDDIELEIEEEEPEQFEIE